MDSEYLNGMSNFFLLILKLICMCFGFYIWILLRSCFDTIKPRPFVFFFKKVEVLINFTLADSLHNEVMGRYFNR